MKFELVGVVWDDAHVPPTETFTLSEVKNKQAPEFISFGLLVRQDDYIGVAAEVCNDGSFRGVTYVPKSLVKEIIPLGSWPKSRRKKKESPAIMTGEEEVSHAPVQEPSG